MRVPVNFTQSIEVGTSDDLPEQWQGLFLREAAEKITGFNARGGRIRGDRLEFLGPFSLFSSHNLLTHITVAGSK